MTFKPCARFASASVDGPGIGLGKVEKFGIFLAAEILRAKQFLKANNLSAARRRFSNARFRLGEIFSWIGRATHLNQANGKFLRHERIIALTFNFDISNSKLLSTFFNHSSFESRLPGDGKGEGGTRFFSGRALCIPRVRSGNRYPASFRLLRRRRRRTSRNS